jgi:hypothetical protein
MSDQTREQIHWGQVGESEEVKSNHGVYGFAELVERPPVAVGENLPVLQMGDDVLDAGTESADRLIGLSAVVGQIDAGWLAGAGGHAQAEPAIHRHRQISDAASVITTRGAEPHRRVRRLHLLRRMELWDERASTRWSCGSVPCAWSPR